MYNILSLLWEGKIQTTEYQETGNKVHEHSLNVYCRQLENSTFFFETINTLNIDYWIQISS